MDPGGDVNAEPTKDKVCCTWIMQANGSNVKRMYMYPHAKMNMFCVMENTNKKKFLKKDVNSHMNIEPHA